MESAFGVDHGEISKAEKKATTGRYAAAYFAPGLHGAVAGKKGRKLRAAVPSSVASSEVPLSARSLVQRSPEGSSRAVRSASAALSAADLGTQHAQKVGHYKKQSKERRCHSC